MREATVTPIVPTRKQGVTITFARISKREIHNALEKLDRFTEWKDSKDFHRFNKLNATIEREHKKAGAWYNKLIQKHAVMVPVKEKLESGDLVDKLGPDGKPVMQPKWVMVRGKQDIAMKDQEAFDKDVNIFHAHSFTVKVMRFMTEDLIKAGLTPAEIRACHPLLSDLDPDMEIEDDEDKEVTDDEIPEDLAGIIPLDNEVETTEPVEGELDDGGNDQPSA